MVTRRLRDLRCRKLSPTLPRSRCISRRKTAHHARSRSPPSAPPINSSPPCAPPSPHQVVDLIKRLLVNDPARRLAGAAQHPLPHISFMYHRLIARSRHRHSIPRLFCRHIMGQPHCCPPPPGAYAGGRGGRLLLPPCSQRRSGGCYAGRAVAGGVPRRQPLLRAVLQVRTRPSTTQ